MSRFAADQVGGQIAGGPGGTRDRLGPQEDGRIFAAVDDSQRFVAIVGHLGRPLQGGQRLPRPVNAHDNRAEHPTFIPKCAVIKLPPSPLILYEW